MIASRRLASMLPETAASPASRVLRLNPLSILYSAA
jgi:hypothetical protein